MSTVALEQASTVAPDMSLIAEQISLIASGIAFCTKRVAGDDVFRARMERMSDEVIALAQDFERYAHNEIAEYDVLASVAEDSDKKLVALRLQVNLLQGNINHLTDELAAADRKHSAAVATSENTISQLRAEMERLTTAQTNELEQSRARADRFEKEAKDARVTTSELTSKLHKEMNAHRTAARHSRK
ncbi:hypothetical protein O3W44_22530 [Pantoea sp. LMR881]|uniref:hypothetical protein n=1 Tax=Pantoea sp. LMR881 TaxID=3014336 RepID=UPI0022AF4F11|nr:hypothetical protein [Pantoea sp. LMR881]MCZ4061200.1 hypothetical protein [Pantoea sp. LMR881]MCZ4061311.1 hypothetical protein [Pantoea sp. LMR881]